MNELEIVTIDDESLLLWYKERIPFKTSLNMVTWYFTDFLSYQEFLEKNKQYVIGFMGISLEALLVDALKKNNLTISFGESCTGGMLASTIINVPGASSVINESYVTYSECAKEKILGVKKTTLEKYSVYSKEVAKEMAEGVHKLSNASISVSVTGRAGGNTQDIKDGTFDFAIITNILNKKCEYVASYKVSGSRNEIRQKQTIYILWNVLKIVNDHISE